MNNPIRKIKNIFYKVLLKELCKKNGLIIYYNEEDSKVIKLIQDIKKQTEIGLLDNEAFNIISLLKSVTKISGDIAEVGVWKGGSSKLICEFKGKKNLHLFDTFEGLPKLSEEDNKNTFKEGQFNYPLVAVQNLLKKYENVFFYKGKFPITTKKIKNKKFSFVHLDVDLYKSTTDALKFFYPRMNKGGIIISHDYLLSGGVKKAFDEFCVDKTTPLIKIEKNQCFIVKI